MSVPFFDLKEPRASLMQVPSGLVEQYAFDQKPPLLQIELPTLEMYCLMGYHLVRGVITGLGLDTLTWRLAPEESSRFPLFANRGLWASYGEISLAQTLTVARIKACGASRLAHSNVRHNWPLGYDPLEPRAQDCRVIVRSAFADGAFYSVWLSQRYWAAPFPDLFAHEIEHLDGPALGDVFSFSELLYEINLARIRAKELHDALATNASSAVIASVREALRDTTYGSAFEIAMAA